LDAKELAGNVEDEVVTQTRCERPEHTDTESCRLVGYRNLCERTTLIRREFHLYRLVV
jgi:hypothetical protein